MGSYSKKEIQEIYSISEDNYEFISVMLESMEKFRRIEAISMNLEEEDKAAIKACEEEFFSIIEDVSDPDAKNAQNGINVRESFADFNGKYGQKLKELEDKYSQMMEQNSMLMKKISEMSDTLMWEDKFDQQLEELEQKGREPVADFARNLCWMLASSIQSYRAVGVGIVAGGDNMLSSKAGDFIGKVSSICGVASHVPFVGSICKLVAVVGYSLVKKDEEYCGKKILEVTSRLYSEKKVLKAVTQSIGELIQSKRFLQEFDTEKQQPLSAQIKKRLGQLQNGVMEKITGIKIENQSELALAYCMQIMCEFLSIDGKPSNPVLIAMRRIISS